MMRVAIVHDWLTGMRGGERCLEAMLDLFPEAEIFTLLHVPGSVSAKIERRPIHASWIRRLPLAARHYRYYLPLFPAAVEGLDPRGFELVLSSSHCVAKSVRPPSGVPHLCYCHSPMRYVWDLYDDYFGPGRASPLVRLAMPAVAARLRRWDAATANRAHAFVANSEHTRERIRRCYGRDAAVVHPPVDVDRFRPAEPREDAYLIVSALVPYKRIDVAVDAFNRLGRRLVVVGDGPESRRLRRMAASNIAFTGRLGDLEVARRLGRCRAFIHPAREDFGIAAVEAQAAGAPVIAFAGGGALETVIDADGDGGRTGILFHEQTADALIDAVHRFERVTFDAAALRANAERFSPDRFRQGLRAQLDRLLAASGAAATRGRGAGQAHPAGVPAAGDARDGDAARAAPPASPAAPDDDAAD